MNRLLDLDTQIYEMLAFVHAWGCYRAYYHAAYGLIPFGRREVVAWG